MTSPYLNACPRTEAEYTAELQLMVSGVTASVQSAKRLRVKALLEKLNKAVDERYDDGLPLDLYERGDLIRARSAINRILERGK